MAAAAAAAAAVEMSVDDDDGDGDEEEAAAAAAEVEVELEAFPDPQRPVSPDSPAADPEPGLSPPLAGLWEAPWSSKSPPPAARGCGEGRGGRGGESLACGQRRRKAECPRRRSCISFTYAGADGQSKRSRASPVSSRRQQRQQQQQEEEEQEQEEEEESGELQRLGTSHRGRSKNSPPPLPLSLPPPLPLLPLPLALPLPEVGEGEGGEGVRWGGGDGGYWEQGGEGGREGEVELIADVSPPGGAASLEGLAAAASLPDSLGIRDLEPSEDQESYPIESEEDDVPFHDDPKDEMYDPSPHRDRGKQRRRPRKEKPDAVETPEPAKRKIQRPKEDRGPRPPKKRKKPPIQYVRCEVEGCGTILANPRYLQHHMRYQHMLKKKYVCPHPSCGRLFRLQKQLLRHTKHHSDQRDYICEYCARAFKSSHNLAVHRMIHTGEKPLQCEICGFTCRQKASLNWHMKKHDAESGYQFPCGVCGKRFEKKDSVVAHKSKSHPEILIAEALAAGSEG